MPFSSLHCVISFFKCCPRSTKSSFWPTSGIKLTVGKAPFKPRQGEKEKGESEGELGGYRKGRTEKEGKDEWREVLGGRWWEVTQRPAAM